MEDLEQPPSSSRIFIKNIPSSLTLETFRKHFSQKAPLTDSRLIPHRRIGYVGYRTQEDAEKAVRYFNRSFIGMARLIVELAKPIYDVDGRFSKRRKLDSPGNESFPRQERDQLNGARQKLVSATTAEEDRKLLGEPKLDEFLEAMQQTSKSKTWRNEEIRLSDKTHEANNKAAEAIAAAVQSEDEYEPLPHTKTKAPKQQASITSNLPSPPQSPARGNDWNVGQGLLGESENAKHADLRPAPSDADWLRSRTSRLLGLVDDDEIIEGRLEETNQHQDIGRVGDSKYHSEPSKPLQNPENVEKAQDQVTEEAPAIPTPATSGNGRLFVRNLTYTVTQDELRMHFESLGYGTPEEVHIPKNSRSGNNKGFAYVQFADPDAASRSLEILDQKPFQGRLLHILPSEAKKQNGLDEYAISKLPLKKQQQIKRRTEAASSTFNWNSMFMSADAVISSISDRLGTAKAELLNPTSSHAAVKQALAETHVIQETKSYFSSQGVNLDAFKNQQRGDRAILVKNFPYGTKQEELTKLFDTYGTITKMLMPSSGTIAIIEFDNSMHASAAFSNLAYRRFKDSLLFLEKAPKDLFDTDSAQSKLQDEAKRTKASASDLLHAETTQEALETSTLFVRNLNFATTNERLHEAFAPLSGFRSARVKTKVDPKKPGQVLSMGFGFLEFGTVREAEAAKATMDGYKLDNHGLLLRGSHKAVDAAQERRNGDRVKKKANSRTKIIIKNLPFEASKDDVRTLFGAFGHLRSVRLPKKFDSSTRGFAFADYVTAMEAENAMEALQSTHLLGRRLVLEFVAEDAIDPEDEIQKMQQKVSKQSNKVALQKLISGSARKSKKLVLEGGDETSQGL